MLGEDFFRILIENFSFECLTMRLEPWLILFFLIDLVRELLLLKPRDNFDTILCDI